MNANAIAHLRTLLGPAVLLPIAAGQKKPTLIGWQKLTPEACGQSHEAGLLAAAAIGVALGPVSGDLISIDIDDDEARTALLALNPWMGGTLTTKGQRGCNFWFRMIGSYPPRTAKILTAHGLAVGEWRSGGGQTIIAGEHPSGQPYRFLVDAPPMSIPLGALRWPVEWLVGKEDLAAFCARWGHWEMSTDSAVQGRPPSSSLRSPSEEAEQQAERNAEVNADSSAFSAAKRASQAPGRKNVAGAIQDEPRSAQSDKLYQRFVGRIVRAERNGRNAVIVATGTFLFHAVAEEVTVALLLRFYDDHAYLWHDPREQHETEIRAHLKNVAARYEREMPPALRLSYDALTTPAQRATFRVCRALAIREDLRRTAPLTFHLSFDDLAARLGVSTSGAFEVMNLLVQRGILTRVSRGQKRALGKKAEASVWRWAGDSGLEPVVNLLGGNSEA